MAKVEIIELLIDETKEEMGINAVSVVESPAIEENFVALQKHEVELKEVDTEKRILMGAALIPNKQIYRKNKDKEFYIYFSEDTVRKASELFLMRSNQNNATYEHERKMLEGMSVVESWIIEDEKTDKSKLYGFSLPKGTWMISMKVNNDEVWKKVKDGEVKGFSIEGYFVDKYDMSKNINEMDTIEKLKELIRKHENETKLQNWQEQVLSMTENDNNINPLLHEVDLSIVDDFKAYISNGKNVDKLFNDLNKRVTNLQKEKADVLNKKNELYNMLTKSNSYAGKTISDYNRQSRELGLNANDNPLFIKVMEQYNKNSDYINKLDSIDKI